jgi:hypothetical protein
MFAVLAMVVIAALTLPKGLAIDTTQGVPRALETVPIELVLLVDVSSSVDETEYELQKRGYENAFRSESLVQAIVNRGGIAVLYVEWSKANTQIIRINWRRLTTAADCDDYANRIRDFGRVNSSNSTRMADAIEFAVDEIRTNPYSGLRSLIDISGDGACKTWRFEQGDDSLGGNAGVLWSNAIATANEHVDQVNGICISTEADVVDFYMNVLPQGAGGFTLQVDSFEAFEEAILTKLLREVDSVPPF